MSFRMYVLNILMIQRELASDISRLTRLEFDG